MLRTRKLTIGMGFFVVFMSVGVSALGQERLRPAARSVPIGSGTLDWSLRDKEDRDDEVEQAALFQPATQPTPAPQPPAPARGTTGGRQSGIRLASAPNMFGDLALAATTVQFGGPSGQVDRTAVNLTLPAAGGGSRIGKIAENDSPIPRDRVFFNYNHFHNVFQLSQQPLFPPGPLVVRQEPIDRYTIGGEKTFFDGWTSIEVRMPFQGIPDTQLTTIGINAGSVGNLTPVFKSLVYMDDTTAVGAGVALETPTGSDLVTRIADNSLRFRNQALHLLPYVGFVWSPGDPRWGWGDGWFFTGFAQIDINTNSNDVDVFNAAGTQVGTLGRLTYQNLGFLDLGAGYWLYRDPEAPRWTGFAVVTELHYTTTLQDADKMAAQGGGTDLTLNATDNRFDVLNGTIGVQALMFDASSFRVAGVFPIGNEDRRLFDAEVQFQFNRRF